MKGFLKIMEELDWPPVFPISPKQFSMLDGITVKEENQVNKLTNGLSAIHYPVITIYPGLKGKVRDNTIYHEIAHQLWPWKPHWWIEMVAERLAGGGGRGYYSRLCNKTLDDVPSRDKIIKMAKQQAKKLKKKYSIGR